MKKYLRITMLLFVAMSLQSQMSAQEEKNTQYQFKLYSSFIYTPTTSDTYQSKSFSFGTIAPSFVISKSKVSHEIGINRLHIGHTRGKQGETLADGTFDTLVNSNNSQFYLSVRYEYAIKFLKIKKKHQLSIAASASPYIIVHTRRYGNSSTKEITAGNKFHLIPRATFSLSNRLFLDINIPVEIMNFSRFNRYTDSPILTEEQRNYNDFLGSTFQFRIGLGFNL